MIKSRPTKSDCCLLCFIYSLSLDVDQVKEVLTTESVTEVLDSDTVSESKTVPLGEEMTEQANQDVDSVDYFKGDKSAQDSSKEAHIPEYYREESRFAPTHFPHLRFYPMKTPGDSSASTLGTSDYMCTSYSSTANTVSSNNMDYVLFPEDYSPLSDYIAEGDESSSADVPACKHEFLWGDPPSSRNAGDVSPPFGNRTKSSESDASPLVLHPAPREMMHDEAEDRREGWSNACYEDGKRSGCGFEAEEDNVDISEEDKDRVDENYVRKSNVDTEER